MSRIIKCLAVDGPCKDRKWDSYSHDVNVKLRGRGGMEHQYRMCGAYPDPEKPIEYFWNDPEKVKPAGDAAEPLPIGASDVRAPAGTKDNPL